VFALAFLRSRDIHNVKKIKKYRPKTTQSPQNDLTLTNIHSMRTVFLLFWMLCGTGLWAQKQLQAQAFAEFEPWLNRQDDSLYVINFWATWCAPCVAELPLFEELAAAYSEQPIKVLLVSLDFPEELDKRLAPFLAKRQLKSQIFILDQDGVNEWMEKISPQWSGAIPATLVYRKGKREFYEKKFKGEELKEAVKSFFE
jgi:thiol-disulfide isomerase/thioredoxin